MGALTNGRGKADPDCGRVAEADFGGVRLSAFRLGPGYRRGSHAHERAGVVMVVRGAFEALTTSGTLETWPGAAGLLPQGIAHKERSGGGETGCLLLEVADVPLLSGMKRLWSRAGVVTHPRLPALAARLWQDALQSANPAATEADALETLFLLCGAAPRPKTRRSAVMPPWVTRSVERLMYGEEPSRLSELADDAGVSREHLARAFRRWTGCSLGEFLRRIRIVRARRVLRSSTLPLSHVALAAGYADQSHMTRAFRRYLARTPGQFREGARG